MSIKIPQTWFLTAIQLEHSTFTFAAVFTKEPSPEDVLERLNEIEQRQPDAVRRIQGAILLALPFGGDLTVPQIHACWSEMLLASGVPAEQVAHVIYQIAGALGEVSGKAAMRAMRRRDH